MSWFQQGQKISEFKPNTKKTSAINGFPFSLDKGESAKIVILNPDEDPPPVLHFHTVPDPSGKFFHRVICALPEDDSCHFCDYAKTLPEGTQWRMGVKKVCCFTILDLRETKDKNGNTYPPQRKLRLTQEGQMKNLQKVWHMIEHDPDYSDIPSLQYSVLTVTRSNEDKSPGIGEAVPPRRMLDLESYDPALLQPMTEEEMLSYFVAKGSPEYDMLVEAYPITEAVSTTVKKKKV